MEWMWIVLAIIVAVTVNGVIAEIEDNSPGGFESPDGKWIDQIKNPTTYQKAVWISAALVIAWLVYYAVNTTNT